VEEKKTEEKFHSQNVVTGRTWIDVIAHMIALTRRRDILISMKIGVVMLGVFFALGLVREHGLTEAGNKVTFFGIGYTKSREQKTNYVRISFDEIDIEVFSRDIDRELVVEALHSKGVDVSEMSPSRSVSGNRPTNTIWYGPNVPKEAVDLVVATLAEGGLEIREIRPFSNPDGKEAKIQIGSREYAN